MIADTESQASQRSATPAAVFDDLATIEQLVADAPEILTISSIRWALRHRHENGLSASCVRLGKRILISRRGFADWLTGQGGA